MNRLHLFTAVVALNCCTMLAVAEDWRQWGGPNHDFSLSDRGLAESWSEDGPKKLWSQRLGSGNSSVVAADGILYAMYRRGRSEFVVAKNASDGETIWEHKYAAPTWDGFWKEHGEGPHATPVCHDGKLYTVGIRALVHCFDAKSGDIVWTRDLWEEESHRPGSFGYASSPLKFKNTLIFPLGGEEPGHGVVAININDGKTVWAKHDYHAAYSSPTLIDLDGQKQCVIFMKKQVIAVNPDNGELFWEYPHITQYDTNASTPIFHEGKNILFCSSAYDSGSRALKLTRDGDKTNVEEVWASKKMEIHHGNAVLIGDSVYGSSGDFGPAFITAIDIETGDVKGKHRDFAKSNFVKVGNRMIVLDEKGRLALASVSPDNFEVLAKAEISDKRCWAAPTLVDTTLYVRDDKKIHAFDLK